MKKKEEDKSIKMGKIDQYRKGLNCKKKKKKIGPK